MPAPIRYPLDPTGRNTDNLVAGELHTLSQRAVRAIAPTYGAFFTESLFVNDQANGASLVRGVHYQCVELLQEPTLLFGKEICALILILDTQVSHQVRVTYQVLGGHYQNDATGIIEMYETAIQDNRPVNWINVLNRPIEYPPALHRHLLEDVYGFEAIVNALERVRNAIILSDVPAYEALIDWVAGQILGLKDHVTDYQNPHHTDRFQVGLGYVENLPVVTESDIISGLPIHRYMTYDRLLYALQMLDVGKTYILSLNAQEVREGYTITGSVSTSGVDNGTVLYWSIEHITTSNNDFPVLAGSVNIQDNEGTFFISARMDRLSEDTEQFRVRLSRGSPTGPVIARSSLVSMVNIPFSLLAIDGVSPAALLACCLHNPNVTINPATYYVVHSLTHQPN